MKHSEMIEEIAQHFDAYKFTNGQTCTQAAICLLRKLEVLGMLPPTHPTKGYEMEELSPTGTIIYSRKTFNEWESE